MGEKCKEWISTDSLLVTNDVDANVASLAVGGSGSISHEEYC